MTRRISAVAACWSSASVICALKRALFALSRLSDFRSASTWAASSALVIGGITQHTGRMSGPASCDPDRKGGQGKIGLPTRPDLLQYFRRTPEILDGLTGVLETEDS